jgi:hypothetical protein
MATVKFTVARGKTELKDVAVAAGAAEAQSETMSLNIDYTKLSKGEALIQLDAIRHKIHAGKWPPLA